MIQNKIIKSAIVLLSVFLALLPATQSAFAESDIVIDGTFTDWSNTTGTEYCDVDANGAKDVNHLYEYQYSGGQPIERVGYFRDINKQCVTSNDTNKLYIFQTAYREILTPYNWDMYEYQTICTLINTDPHRNNNFDYAVCTDIDIAYCTGPNPACNARDNVKVQLMSCNDRSDTICGNASTVKTYASSKYANDVGNKMTFPVWAGPQLISFFDDMTEIEVPFSDLNVNRTDQICFNTNSYIFLSDTIVIDSILNSGDQQCVELNSVPTAVQLASQQSETAGSSVYIMILASLLLTTTLPLIFRQKAS